MASAGSISVPVEVEYVNKSMGPVPVTIVRTSTDSEMYIAEVFDIALKAWIVMLLLPTFTEWNLSYFQTVALVIVTGYLFNSPGWLKWTKRLKR